MHLIAARLRLCVCLAFFLAIIALAPIITTQVRAEDKQQELEIRIKSANPGGSVTVQVINKSSNVVKLWDGPYSWAWGNWMFQFYHGNELHVYVHDPKAVFTRNVPVTQDVPASSSIDITFHLDDKDEWIKNRIPLYPQYGRKQDSKHGAHGCIAVLSVGESEEGEKQKVWKGTYVAIL